MGLKKLILVSDVCKDKESAESVGAGSVSPQTNVEEKSDIEVLPQTDVEHEWYYLGPEIAILDLRFQKSLSLDGALKLVRCFG